MLVLIPLALLYDHEAIRRFYSPFVSWYARKLFLPFTVVCLGVYRIRWHGRPDPRARCFVYNHVSLFDGAFVYVGSQYTIVILSEVLKVSIVGRALKSAGALFMNRRGSQRNGRILANAMNKPSCPPLAVAPEAMISNGQYLFLTDQPIQPHF
jgi:1-acyl-sn-glycerol-3-phosphate acyltransferase